MAINASAHSFLYGSSKKNKHRFKKSGEVKINDNALVALALLVAQSNPNDKDIMIKLITNLVRS